MLCCSLPQILDKVRWDPVSEANVEFFSAYGQDIVHRGSTFTKPGGIIGIPINFMYRSVDDIDKEKITINNKPIDWNTPAGRSLQESLVLSEKARKFAIARELFYLHTHHVHLRGLFVGGSAFIAYWLGFAVNRLNRLPQRTTLPARIILYGFFTGIGAVVYCLASDTYSWYRDRKVDRQAGKLGKEYTEGGAEFYTKLLERNIALRTLMGPDGPRRYTAYGNDVHYWRSPSVPLTSRRDMLVELGKQQNCSSSTTPAAEPA